MKHNVAKALIAIVIPFIFLMGVSPSGLPNTTSGTCPAANMGDQKWERLGSADFPARVKAVAFKTNVLDADHSVSWGRWTVSFDKDSPVAYWLKCGSGNCDGGFTINKLICTNSVSGQKSCFLLFIFDRRRGSICNLSISGESENIGIRCPVDVKFED